MSTMSEFYIACRDGDLNTVQQVLPTISDDQKNSIESNGSTALHAATSYGHHDIVRLLLENGFATWILNKYNNTPYDEANDEEMRQLFHRPDSNDNSTRFASVDDCFNMVTYNSSNNSTEKVGDVDNIPKGLVNGYKYTGTGQKRDTIIKEIVYAQMMKFCLKKFQVRMYFYSILSLL